MKRFVQRGKIAEPPPLLSEAEMKRLHEEIFEEPVSVEILLQILARARAASASTRRQLEWVMTYSTWSRIRQLAPPSPYFEFSTKPADLVPRLFDLPVAIEPLAKLAIREVTS